MKLRFHLVISKWQKDELKKLMEPTEMLRNFFKLKENHT